MTEREQREALESNGACVTIKHYRRPRLWPEGQFISAGGGYRGTAGWHPKGGITRVTIEYADGRKATGEARCSSQDNFSRLRGRQIALGRAMKNIIRQEA